MLVRQHAEALLGARAQIVNGAVEIAKHAARNLAEGGLKMDESEKARMVCSIMIRTNFVSLTPVHHKVSMHTHTSTHTHTRVPLRIQVSNLMCIICGFVRACIYYISQCVPCCRCPSNRSHITSYSDADDKKPQLTEVV